jgi:DNA topoisomerase-1
MKEIQQDNETKQNVLQNAIEALKNVTSELKEKETKVGAKLSQRLQKSKLKERTIGSCPKCSDGKLVILRSKKTGKRFVGCTNYFEKKCNTAFPLPQTGTVKPSRSVCKSCGSPIVAVYLSSKRLWRLCLNPNCPSKGVSNK